MKKILLVLVFFIGTCSTKAFEFTYSDWSTTYPENVKDILIQSEDRYLWYKEEISNIKYLTKEEIGDKLYDENDIKYYESEEMQNKPQELSERVIKEFNKQIVYTNKDVSGFYINNKNTNIKISEIIVSDEDGNIINYDSKYNYLNDNDRDSYNICDEEIYIKFDKKYDIDKIYINVYFNKEDEEESKVRLNILSDSMDTIYYVDYRTGICLNRGCSLSAYRSVLVESLYHDKKMYKYIDKLYKTYTLDKKYTDDYYKEYDGYTKDETTKKTYYRYITNEFVVLDANNQIVTDEKYCNKYFCKVVFLNKESEKEIVKNPKTYDPLYDYVILFIVSSITLSYFIVKKSRTNKKSNYVESL